MFKKIHKFKIAAFPSHSFIFYLVKITKISLNLCSFEIRDYFWAKTSVYVCLVYVVWPLEGLSNSPMFLSQKSLLKMPILYEKLGLAGLFFPPLYFYVYLKQPDEAPLKAEQLFNRFRFRWTQMSAWRQSGKPLRTMFMSIPLV